MAKKPTKKKAAKKPVNKTKARKTAKAKEKFIYFVLCISLRVGRKLFSTGIAYESLKAAQERVKWSKNLDRQADYDYFEYLILQFKITPDGKTK